MPDGHRTVARRTAKRGSDDHRKSAKSTRKSHRAHPALEVSAPLPGISRKRFRGKWRYVDEAGETITDEAFLDRVKKLAIPPAWTGVWICPVADGHIQATGRDARGRKQYIYHPEWREQREAAKFARLAAFGAALPAIREHVARDLRARSDDRRQLLGAAVALLDCSLIRIGNREYLRKNGSAGLTTMRRRDCKIHGADMRFKFLGKSGKKHDITVRNKRVARILERCRALKGPTLLQYPARSGECQALHSSEVNRYLRSIAGPQFSAKDFRTWAASAQALDLLLQAEQPTAVRERKRTVNGVLAAVAERLGNTPGICRKSYVHPAIIAAFEGDGFGALKPATAPEESEANLLRFLRSVRRRSREDAA